MTGLAGLLSNRYYQDDIPDQRGRTAIVTGGTAGIGRQIAKGLAVAGARVIIVGATEEHAQEAINEINVAIKDASTGSPKVAPGKVESRTLDLGSLTQVKAFAERMLSELALKESQGGLHILINNAGVGAAPFGLTKDGLGNHFQVNHLAGMLLTTILLPLLEASATPGRPSRIVMESSELHRFAPSDVEFKTVAEMNQEDRDPTVLYNRSKLMMILFAKQLAKRKLIPDGNKVVIIATHPGAVATDQEKGLDEAYGALGTAITAASRVLFMSPEQGSECALWAATSPKVAEQASTYQGAYIRQADDSLGTESNQATDEALGSNLWQLSKQVIKEKTGIEVGY